MDAFMIAAICIVLLYNLATIAWEYLIHRQLTKLEEKNANMQIGFKQMSERVGYLEESVFELTRKVKQDQNKSKVVRKKP
jgi:hypothetical protein